MQNQLEVKHQNNKTRCFENTVKNSKYPKKKRFTRPEELVESHGIKFASTASINE